MKKKETAEKSETKRPPKKAAAKKTVVKKVAVKKVAAKKTAAEKSVVKKTTVKKTVAKKPRTAKAATPVTAPTPEHSNTQTLEHSNTPTLEHPKKFIPPPKKEKTAEDYAAIAVLDALRKCEGETQPKNLPLACVVKVVDYEDVPKANEAFAMVRVQGPGKKEWRMCVRRKTVKKGTNALFVSDNAALPMDARFRNPAVCSVKEKVYKYGFGITSRRMLPHVQRHIYRLNNGVLYPIESFEELRGKRAGAIVPVLLKIDDAEEMKIRQNQPRAYRVVFRP